MAVTSVKEARELLLKAVKAPIIQELPLMESLGYILAVPITTKHPIPHFNKSPYDGFAFACPPEGSRGLTLKVIGRIGAGESFDGELGPQEALRIMTGAPIPKGADTVAMFEQCDATEGPDGPQIFIRAILKKGDNIICMGEECDAHTTVIEEGTYITAGTIALLASLGYEKLSVYSHPKVALLTSGKELIPLGQPLREATIYNSNGPMLEGLLAEEGLIPTFTGHITDDPSLIDKEIKELLPILSKMDIIISTGGASVGDFDFMPKLYEALGAKTCYRRIAMRPGSAQYGGFTEHTICIGLSGNPSAAFNGFHLIGAPILRKAKGEKQLLSLPIVCTLGRTIKKKNPFDRYIQGALINDNEKISFLPVDVFTSNAIVGLAMSDALYKMPQGQSEVQEGSSITVYLLQKRGTQ